MNAALLASPFASEWLAWLGREFPAAPAAAFSAVACLLGRLAEGHVCLDLAAEAGQPGPDGSLPALADWRAALLASGFVGRPGQYFPLLLDGDRLYLARLWADETGLARELRRRAGASDLAPAAVRKVLDRLFAGTAPEDGQRQAAATALLNRICLISGGPGTGKTTTVAKVLAALLQLEPGCRMVLAAPTGRAAARMLEALNQAKQALGLDLVEQACLPARAYTLHRLLGYRPDSASPRHGPGQPLDLDLLVVDEASMIDLALFHRLLLALPEGARLIVLGDRDQLASVEAGSAFAELLSLDGPSQTGARRLAEACGSAPLAPGQDGQLTLADGIAMLRHSHRFAAGSGIGELARLANAGDSAGLLALLRTPQPDLAWQAGRVGEWMAGLLARLGEALAPYRAAVAAGQVEQAFAAFQRLRVLCAVREGPAGVSLLNRLVEQRLFGQDSRRQPWYAGRPVIVRVNDSALSLANGDVGLCLAGPDGLRVHFPGPDGWRALAPARLPAHDSAFALTVHQAQGSEFEEVWFVLPDEEVAVLNRSLIYTAVTRARQRVQLWGSATTLAAALGRQAGRSSGLAARLSAPAD